MRGSLSIFSDIFSPEPEVKTPGRKGRSPELNALRNECLIHRYYYYCTTMKDKKYESIIELLSKEFFISCHRIPDILTAAPNIEALKRLKNEKPVKGYFQKKYPHLTW